MKTKRLSRFHLIMVIGALALGLLIVTSTAQAASNPNPAAQSTPGPLRQTLIPVRETLAALPTPDGIVLENGLVRVNLALSNQGTRLTLAHTVRDETQTYINNQKNAGKDTSTLESALSVFNQSILQAEADHTAAATILSAPAGFDASGKVTDRKTAQQTLRTAGQSLRQAHLTLTQATLNLRLAVSTYRGK